VSKSDLYTRKSSKDDGRSVEAQEDDWRDDCGDQDLEPGRVFTDPDRSASRHARKGRPDFDALIEHIKAGHCEVLSLWEASRGSRKVGEWADFLDLCRNKKVLIRVISHSRTYDMSVRRDWRTLIDEGVDAADESEKISERTRRGKRKAAMRGRPVGRLAYGFKRVYDDRGHFVEQVEHPDQAPVVREIVRRLADREPAGQVARDLNARRIQAPLGGPWSDRQVRQIAIKPSYAGQRVHQGETVGDGCWEPIVDPQVWHQAYSLLTQPGRKHNNDSRLSHWLTGAVTCGLCRNKTLRAQNRRDGSLAYQCRGCLRVSASGRGLESIIETLILWRARQRDVLTAALPKQDTVALAAAEAEEQTLRRRLDEARAEWKTGRISAASFGEMERDITPDIELAAAKVRKLSIPPALAELANLDIVNDWVDMGVRLRREIVVALADIVIAPGAMASGPRFDRLRLVESRWRGEERNWGQMWGVTP
jgi:site-specific DNA recombinase